MNGRYLLYTHTIYLIFTNLIIFLKNFRGETIWPDNKKYIGEYVDDKKDGEGIFEWGNGKKYEGRWVNGK